MTNNTNLEQRIQRLVRAAKNMWGRRAEMQRVTDYDSSGNSATIYCGKRRDFYFSNGAPRVNKGEYLLVRTNAFGDQTLRVYSPELKYQFTLQCKKSHSGSLTDNAEGYP